MACVRPQFRTSVGRTERRALDGHVYAHGSVGFENSRIRLTPGKSRADVGSRGVPAGTRRDRIDFHTHRSADFVCGHTAPSYAKRLGFLASRPPRESEQVAKQVASAQKKSVAAAAAPSVGIHVKASKLRSRLRVLVIRAVAAGVRSLWRDPDPSEQVAKQVASARHSSGRGWRPLPLA